MNMSTTRLIALFVAFGLGSVACSANPQRFDTDKPGDEQQASDEIAAPVEKDPIAPLELRDGMADITMLDAVGTTQEMMVGDLRVIHKLTPNNPVVSAQLYRVGGSAGLSPAEAGIEKLALVVAANGGTETTPKDEFNAALDSTGSSVYSFAERDWSGYGMKTLVDHFDDTWALFTQTIMEPAFPESEIELRRTRQLAEIRSLLENPDTHVAYVAGQNMFEGHPYQTLQIGTEDNVKRFTRKDLREYQRQQLDPSQMLLVVVGNVQPKRVAEAVQKSLGRIPGSGKDVTALPSFTSPKGRVQVVDRELPTNYVLGYFDAPAPGDDDYAAMLVAVEYLRDKLFEEVRTKRNLTYAVSAGLGARRENYGYLYVTAVDPETTMRVMFDVVEELKLIKLPKSELEQTVNVFITDHYMGLETNGSQADMLAEAQLMEGSWKESNDFLERVRGVTPEQVQQAAQKYMQGYRFGVIGKKDGLKAEYFTP
jgi:zinc protease